MKTAFLLYSLDREGKLKSYFTVNGIDSRVFILSSSNDNDDIIDTVLDQLDLELTSNRILYLGNFQFESISDTNIDVVAINVSSLSIREFVSDFSLRENPSHQLAREDNAFLLAIMFKMIVEKLKFMVDETIDDEGEEQENKKEEDVHSQSPSIEPPLNQNNADDV